MSDNHDAIVVDAKNEGGGGCPVAHDRAPTRPKAAETANGGPNA